MNINLCHSVQNKKKVKRVMTRVIYYNGLMYLFYIKNKKTIFYLYNDINKNPVEIDIKKSKPLFVDKETNEVFGTTDVSTDNPIKIGVINENNKLKKII